MAQWIAILVALVCLSGSSLSRSWVGFDDTDALESWQADANDYGSNRKSKYYSGDDSWESDEDYEDSGYVNGYEHDKPILSNNGYYKNHGSRIYGYHDHHQGGHNHDHRFNGGWGHHGHHTQTGTPDQPDQHWGHHNHSPSSDQPGQNFGPQGNHGQSGFTGQRGQNCGSHGHQSQTGSPGQPGRHWATHGHNTQTPNLGQPVQSPGTSRELPQNNVNPPQGSGKDADRIVFPDLNNQAPTTRPSATATPTATTARTTTSTTTRTTTTDRTLLDLVICIRACPTTSEYNPVCGTNNVTYNNQGGLQCARNCGLNVAVARQAPCPRSAPQPTTTARPVMNSSSARSTPRPAQTTTMRAVTPTSSTNINGNFVNNPGSITIPTEILQSVFGIPSPTNSNPEESEFDIDRRGNP